MAVTKPEAKVQTGSVLQALTTAALALPGLMLPAAHAADEEAGFQYGHYQESSRELYGLKSVFDPIKVTSLFGTGKFNLADRLKFAFNYTQDTWGGATPVATAPLAFEGNRENVVLGGATPYLQNNNVYFDKNFNPLAQDPLTGAFRKDRRLVHTLSSASPETRNQGDFKLGYEWDEAALGIGGGISSEHDYESRFGNVSGRWDLNQKLTTLNLGLSYTNSDTFALLDHDAVPYIDMSAYQDQIKLGPRGARTLYGTRQDWATYFGVTQVLDKSSLLEAGVGYQRGTGYMANPYKAVNIAFVDPQQTSGPSGELSGTLNAFLEKRPDVRNQVTGSLRYVLHVDPLDAAVHLGYTFFHDDWDINAHTFEADWGQPLGYGWTITPRVRYYSQNAADFYQPYLISHQAYSKTTIGPDGKVKTTSYDPRLLPAHYSSDQRLSGYGAISGGITLSKQFAKGVTLEAGAEYYSHAGDLKMGGGGEDAFADFNYYSVNAALKVNLEALSLAGEDQADHAHHMMHHAHHAHAPAGVMFDHMLSTPGQFMVGYRYMYSNQSGTMLHGSHEVGDQVLVSDGCRGNPCYVTPREMSMDMHMLDLMYAPTDWLNLMLMPQFVNMSMFMRPVDGAPTVSPTADPGLSAAIQHSDHEHMTGGVGDTGMYALFKLFNSSGHSVHATLGISAPTGQSDIKLRPTHRQNLGYIHYGMQLGSGTWDFKPSLTYLGQLDDWSWGAQLSGTKRLEDQNDSGFAFGDIFQTTAWGSYDLLDWLSASVRGVYTVQGSLKGAYKGTYHQIGPMDYANSYGGRYWDLGLGLSAVVPSGELKGNRLSFEWLQPLHDDVNGYQLPRDAALSATWSYAF